MSLHFAREVAALKKRLLGLCAVVEDSVQKAVEAVGEKDAELARAVIEADSRIDQMEVEVEEDCLKILALHQPVAIDLRFVIACLKMNNDLERIGDLSVNVAERAVYLAARQNMELPFDLPGMAAKSKEMLRKSLDALVNMDIELAREVLASDDDVDALHREMYVRVKEAVAKDPSTLDVMTHIMCVSSHLERIADHATNIAEDVIYMVKGEIVRHQPDSVFTKRAEGQNVGGNGHEAS
jgi:phosphate transport system protein